MNRKNFIGWLVALPAALVVAKEAAASVSVPECKVVSEKTVESPRIYNEMLRTFSDDGGKTWYPQTRLHDKRYVACDFGAGDKTAVVEFYCDDLSVETHRYNPNTDIQFRVLTQTKPLSELRKLYPPV